MKRVCKIITVIAVLSSVIISCQKQNEYKSLEVKSQLQRSDEYFANLRAYKKSDHQVYFGWFGGTGGAGNPMVPGILDQIPDSVDIVSLWGGYPSMGSYNDEAMKRAQQKKGTRFVLVVFDDKAFLNEWSDTSFVSVYDKGDDMLLKGFEVIAKNVKDTIDRYKLDGLDLDHEPNVCGCDWGLLKDARKYSMFLKVLSRYFGPISGTDKLFIVDGEYSMISADAAKGLSYIATQAYGTGSPGSLQGRFNTVPAGFPPGKFIVTENFESYWSGGGVNYFDPVRGTIPSLLGMAYWQPNQGRKGGAGAYHAEYEYPLNPDYKYTRQAIQIMNPAAK